VGARDRRHLGIAERLVYDGKGLAGAQATGGLTGAIAGLCVGSRRPGAH
jgi:hypothetical protein